MTAPIDSFSGRYRFLSNFYIEETGLSVEHHFQAAKTDDPSWKARILTAPTPGRAKKLGGQAPIRIGWDNERIMVMQTLLYVKFMDEALAVKLINTAPAHLEEGNVWDDTFWGTVEGRGRNVLGDLLMEVRDVITQIDNW